LAEHTWAAWVPDGHRLVVSGAEPGKGSRLFLQDVAGGLPRPLTGEGVRLRPFVARVVSPDGRFVTALRPDGEAAVYPVEGGEPRPIAGLGNDLVPLGWTDRPGVLFARSRRDGRTCPVYRVDVTTGRRQLWKEVGSGDPSGSPSVEFVTVSADGGSYAHSITRLDADLFVVSGAFP
jgi:eukaryotic-like serine/threonine-protein kinase